MRTALAILAVTIVAYADFALATGQQSCLEYDFDLRFFPAFHLPLAVSISAREADAAVAVTYGNARTHGHGTERFLLPRTISEAFCSKLLQLIARAPRPDRRLVVDGIGVEGAFRPAGSPPFVFSWRSRISVTIR